MVGRASLGRPWLPGEIEAALSGPANAALSAAERSEIAIEHYRELLAHYGVTLGMRQARKHLVAYAAHALAGAPQPRAAAIKAALPRSEEPGEVESLLREAFALAADHPPRPLAEAA
jgi:tRNA-dihydrouridine synthase